MQLAATKTQDQPKPTPWWVIGVIVGGWAAAISFLAWRAKKAGRFEPDFEEELDGVGRARWHEQLPGGRAAGRRPEEFDPVQLRRAGTHERSTPRDGDRDADAIRCTIAPWHRSRR